MDLSRYVKKRDFTQTREPRGAGKINKSRPGARFLVQKHAASHLHYDLRLEVDGVLKSWAVPKGIPTEKGEKRLAMHVEDHPLEYGSFEGTIPAGNYGAGTVMLWDTGTFESLAGDPSTALQKGKIEVRFSGNKLKGEWTLVQMRRTDDGKNNAWLLIKTGDTVRKISARADNRSVASGRTMKQITDTSDATWRSNRAASSGSSKITSAKKSSWSRAKDKPKPRRG
ncbi:MAG: bifunctional non-ous end joining protein LigD [Verrucomicrobiota bacterium]|jgi:bifunctional non-homologous end joining protein LigD